MGIFAKLDAANVKTNPFFVEEGDYSAEVVDAKIATTSTGQRQLVITYQINNEDSMYLDKKVNKFYFLPDPDLDEETLSLLPADEQTKILNTLSSLKRDLCGNSANPRQKGLGVDEDVLNSDNWDPKTLIGTKVDIGINNYAIRGASTKEGVNVKWVNLTD